MYFVRVYYVFWCIFQKKVLLKKENSCNKYFSYPPDWADILLWLITDEEDAEPWLFSLVSWSLIMTSYELSSWPPLSSGDLIFCADGDGGWRPPTAPPLATVRGRRLISDSTRPRKSSEEVEQQPVRCWYSCIQLSTWVVVLKDMITTTNCSAKD